MSLVMPVWKPHPQWFREAVNSALGQRSCSIELVVVDDGNEEPVRDLLSSVDDDRLVVIRVPHGGASRARNAGIEHAAGDMIRFVDADDVLAPDSTARLLRLSGPDRAIAYGSTLVCDPDLRPLRTIEATVQGDALAPCLLGRLTVRFVSMLFPREIVTAIGGFDSALEPNEDYDYVLRAIELAPVRGERVVATHYRRHPASLTAGPHAGKKLDMQALEKLFERRPDLLGTRLERVARAQIHMNAARQLLLVGQLRRCALELLSAGRLDPIGSLPGAGQLGAIFVRLAARRARRLLPAYSRRPKRQA